MAVSLLGYWPGEWTEPSAPHSPSLTDQSPGCHSRQDSGSATARANLDRYSYSHAFASINLPFDEDIYNAPTPPQTPPLTGESGLSSTVANRLKSRVMKDIDVESIDWRMHHPPLELVNVPTGTSMEIESIIEPSVDIMQNMLAEEESLRQNVALLREQEASKAGDSLIVVAGNGENSHEGLEVYVPGSGTEIHSNGINGDTVLAPVESPISIASPSMASSGDSGYGSRSSDSLPPKSRMGNIFSLRGTLRRSKNRLSGARQASTPTLTKECVSCFDVFRPKDAVQLSCHSYCKPCFQTLISTAIASEDHWPPKCCLNGIPKESVLPHLNMRTRRKYRDILEERSVPAGDRIYCSKASCASWIPPKNISKAISCAICQSCRQKTCTSCRGIYHASGECPQDPTLQATLQLANDEGWRRCYSCNAVVEHNQGCIHMTCKCKAQFCYICGLRWRTCSCRDDQLDTLQQAAETRRLAALAREEEARAREQVGEEAAEAAAEAAEVEAAELCEILEEIERFEMEETLQLAREEEELRLVTVASRQRQQEEQIMAISKRYFDLREELEFLHALQKVAMVERYESEIKKLWVNEGLREAMKARHTIELELSETEAQTRISDSQYAFDQAYQARVSKERQIEDKYSAELRVYWESRPNGEVEIINSMAKLQTSHAESHRRWDEAEREMHQLVIDSAQEEVNRVKHKHELELLTMTERISNAEKEIRRKEFSDANWLKAVATMRTDMLLAMEEDEYLREEDWS